MTFYNQNKYEKQVFNREVQQIALAVFICWFFGEYCTRVQCVYLQGTINNKLTKNKFPRAHFEAVQFYWLRFRVDCPFWHKKLAIAVCIRMYPYIKVSVALRYCLKDYRFALVYKDGFSQAWIPFWCASFEQRERESDLWRHTHAL